MSHPQDLSLCEQARLIASGDLDPAQLLTMTLERIEERNPAIRAVAETFADQSAVMLAEAPDGPLHGVPITMKDMFSLPWRGYRNGTRYELGTAMASGPFRRLRDAGAVIVGVDNQHELGLGTTGIASAYGPAGNPWNPEHCAGGSSGGSAAAVAARLVAGSVGSDSGGSTRLPAGWCGVVGLKVTFRSLPYDGYSGVNSTLSGPGAFGRDAADTRLLLEALLARPLPVGDGSALRVAVIRDPFWTDLDPEVAASCEAALTATAWQVDEVALPYAELAASAGGVRAATELGMMVPSQVLPDVDPITRGMLQYSALMPARRLLRADRVRAKLRRGLADLFAAYDAVAWPTNPAPAPPIANPIVQLPSGPALADTPNLRQAVIANLAGIPGVSVPVGLHSTGLPIGLQLLATWGGEATLLDAANQLEQSVDRTAFASGVTKIS